MLNTRGSSTLITKLATAVIATGKPFCSSSSSSYSLHNPNDMANIANARRNMDDYMRRIQKREEDSSSGNFKCEITRKTKRAGQVDCNCECVCMAKVSETMMIHKEGKSEEEKK